MEKTLVFEEYLGKDDYGYVNHPYLSPGIGWCINENSYTLEDIGKRCNIPEDELLILKLKYGSEGIHRRV